MTGSIGLAMLLRGSVIVAGATTCPAPAVVQSLIPEQDPRQQGRDPDQAELDTASDRLRVRLLDNRGRLLAERELDSHSSCAGLAVAAAAVIGTMELEVSVAPGVDEVPLPAPREPKAPAFGGGVVQANSAPPARRPRSFDIGPSLLGSADSGGRTTWVVGLTLTLAPWRFRFRPEVGVFAEGPRDLFVDDGRVSYQRFWLSSGLGYELSWGQWSIEPQAEVLLGALRLGGDGVTSVATAWTGELGAQAGLTARWTLGLPAVRAGLFILAWPGGTQVQIGQPSQSRPLPAWEGLLGLGVDFGAG